jgi:hypothetical protein
MTDEEKEKARREKIKQKYLDDLWEDLRYSISKFDEQLLIISGGALGISLSFIKDIVPLKDAIWIWLYYTAIGSFTFCIGFGFLNHLRSADSIYDRYEKVNNEKYDFDLENNSKFWNRLLTVSLTTGIITLVLFCIINIENYR